MITPVASNCSCYRFNKKFGQSKIVPNFSTFHSDISCALEIQCCLLNVILQLVGPAEINVFTRRFQFLLYFIFNCFRHD